jgi:hypothetical protein
MPYCIYMILLLACVRAAMLAAAAAPALRGLACLPTRRQHDNSAHTPPPPAAPALATLVCRGRRRCHRPPLLRQRVRRGLLPAKQGPSLRALPMPDHAAASATFRSLRSVAMALCWTLYVEGSYGAGVFTMPATRYASEAGDLGSYSVDVSIGTPGQQIRAQVDTGSGLLVVPSMRAECQECSARGGNQYDSSASSSARKIPCHSNECAQIRPSKHSSGVPTVCALKSRSGQSICPRQRGAPLAFGGAMRPEGAGQCIRDPGALAVLNGQVLPLTRADCA